MMMDGKPITQAHEGMRKLRIDHDTLPMAGRRPKEDARPIRSYAIVRPRRPIRAAASQSPPEREE
jgi:hypothetical protein